jgi:phosphate transport system protein
MGRLDEKQITNAIEALQKRDCTLAKQVIAADDQLDALQRDIEERAVITIARRQPMAGDLRAIVGAFRISNDLERIGDLAENIARRVVLLVEEFWINGLVIQLQRMVELVNEQLTRVLQSYEGRDITEALEVWRKDEEIDALYSSLFRELLTHMMENPRTITYCTHLLFCAKNIERMGDHVTNIAETVYYIVEGRTLSGKRPKADTTTTIMQPLPGC